MASSKHEQRPLLDGEPETEHDGLDRLSESDNSAHTPPLDNSSSGSDQLWKIPIAKRPPGGGSIASRFLMLPLFLIGCVLIVAAQVCFYPFYPLKKIFGDRGMFGNIWEWGVERTKQAFGELIIFTFMFFAPTTITITTPDGHQTQLPLSTLTARDPKSNKLVGLNLPKNLIIMANHQTYLDWMIIWIMGYHAVTPAAPNDHSFKPSAGSQPTWQDHGHGSRSIIILLKKSLKHLPLVGWGMQFYRFIFMSRSWASDKNNLTLALSKLSERSKWRTQSGVWLTIFPEGTITSDDERVKSKRFSEKEEMPDFISLLQPRSTGLLFCLRTLLPQVPDLKILDLTIGYPGVPRGGYAQEWYGLKSVFQWKTPPPTLHVHLRIIDPRVESIPGVFSSMDGPRVDQEHDHAVKTTGIASEAEANAFGDWLRSRWREKEILLDGFTDSQWAGFEQPSKRRSLAAWGVSEQDEGDIKTRLYGRERVEVPIQFSL